jgi:aldehyde dehydrogenase
MKYVPPGQLGSIVEVKPRYENFIGGKWLAPTEGKYRVDLTPATAKSITEVAQSTPADVELALDAAFDRLRRYARTNNLRLSEVARRCVDHQLDLDELTAAPVSTVRRPS